MAGDEIIMPENAFLMFHDPSSVVIGTVANMRDMARTLVKIAAKMTSGYTAKSGKPEAKIAALIAPETRFDAKVALETGLANRMAEPVLIAASFDIGLFRNAPTALVEAIAAKPATTTKDIVGDHNDVEECGDPAPITAPATKVPTENIDPPAAADNSVKPKSDVADIGIIFDAGGPGKVAALNTSRASRRWRGGCWRMTSALIRGAKILAAKAKASRRSPPPPPRHWPHLVSSCAEPMHNFPIKC